MTAAGTSLVLHPHWKRLVRPLAVLPVLAGTASYLEFAFPDRPVRWLVGVVALLAVLRWTVRPVVRWSLTRYVITDERLSVRSGLFTRGGQDIPLHRVTAVTFRAGPVDRMLGCGALDVHCGGDVVQLTDVPNVRRVASMLSAGAPASGR